MSEFPPDCITVFYISVKLSKQCWKVHIALFQGFNPLWSCSSNQIIEECLRWTVTCPRWTAPLASSQLGSTPTSLASQTPSLHHFITLSLHHFIFISLTGYMPIQWCQFHLHPLVLHPGKSKRSQTDSLCWRVIEPGWLDSRPPSPWAGWMSVENGWMIVKIWSCFKKSWIL